MDSKKVPKTELEILSEKLVKRGYQQNCSDNPPSQKEIANFKQFSVKHNFVWHEGWFLPENKEYPIVLKRVEKSDVILDIGAGNFALDLLLSEKCQKVYAVELNPFVVSDALKIIGYQQPRNLILICANGLDFAIPKEVNHLVMLLRHFSQTLPSVFLEIPKITAQIYGEWLLVPEEEEVLEVANQNQHTKT